VLVVVFSSNAATAREYAPRSVSADWSNRLARCAFGLALFGAGIALILQAHLGAAPWDMLHQGLSNKTGISVGVIIEAVGFVLLLLWIPLKQRPGVGTILNAFEIGFVVDLVAPHLPDSDRLLVRAGYLVAGIVIIAIGSGFYIGAGLGPGPRDGLMLGLEQRGLSVRTARTPVRRNRRHRAGRAARRRHAAVHVRHWSASTADLAAVGPAPTRNAQRNRSSHGTCSILRVC